MDPGPWTLGLQRPLLDPGPWTLGLQRPLRGFDSLLAGGRQGREVDGRSARRRVSLAPGPWPLPPPCAR